MVSPRGGCAAAMVAVRAFACNSHGGEEAPLTSVKWRSSNATKPPPPEGDGDLLVNTKAVRVLRLADALSAKKG